MKLFGFDLGWFRRLKPNTEGRMLKLWGREISSYSVPTVSPSGGTVELGAGMLAPPPILTACAKSHPGLVRKINEDSVLDGSPSSIWAVADGVGGYEAGDFASQSLMEALRDLPTSLELDQKTAWLRTVIQRHHTYLQDVAAERGGATIATTVVALTILGWRYQLLWAGDSRLYLYRKKALTRLSHDHSYVQELVDQGVLKAEDAESHPRANVITSAVGAGKELRLDASGGNIQPGDLFLICSDGLTRMVSEADIRRTLDQNDLEQVADDLIELALAAGGRDNISVVLVRCAESSSLDF